MTDNYNDPRWQHGSLQDMTDGNFELSRIHRILPSPNESEKILDIGCWVGTLVNKLLDKWYNAVWVDINMPLWSPEKWRIKADISKLPFPDETFSIITSASVFDRRIYVWQPQEAMLGEIYRVLKPNWRYIRIEGAFPGMAISMNQELWEEEKFLGSGIWIKKRSKP
jgi:ubiquinone/menaquinone biosynthesis C-methylase UbiE